MMYSSNPFPQLPSSTNGFSPPNSIFFHEKEGVHYTCHHQKNDDPFISGDFLFHTHSTSADPPVMENVTTIEDFVSQHQFSEGSGLQYYSEDHSDLLDSVISPYKKKLERSKKDAHSKIYTARGPRDRRVRLSIEISRKFFCLQDLLGFDKASKTLDWLFTKSRSAIKELVEETSCSSSTVTDQQSRFTFLETINGGSGSEKKPVHSVSKRKNTTRRCKPGIQEDLARDQSRTEARARARERTREKLLVKKLDDDLKTLAPCDSGNFWCQNEAKIDYKDITWECTVDRETSKQSKDSSFQIHKQQEV